MEWARLHEDLDYPLIAETAHGDLLVRTVWSGMDDGVGVAPMYLTGLRDAGGSWSDAQELFWPCTADDAKTMHDDVVETLRRTR